MPRPPQGLRGCNDGGANRTAVLANLKTIKHLTFNQVWVKGNR